MGRRALILGRGTAMQKHTSGAETNIPARQMPKLQQMCNMPCKNLQQCILLQASALSTNVYYCMQA